jgi:hypothetical protein
MSWENLSQCQSPSCRATAEIIWICICMQHTYHCTRTSYQLARHAARSYMSNHPHTIRSGRLASRPARTRASSSYAASKACGTTGDPGSHTAPWRDSSNCSRPAAVSRSWLAVAAAASSHASRLQSRTGQGSTGVLAQGVCLHLSTAIQSPVPGRRPVEPFLPYPIRLH